MRRFAVDRRLTGVTTESVGKIMKNEDYKMQIKRNMVRFTSALALFSLLLSGCGKANTETQTPPANQPDSSVSDGQSTQNGQGDALMQVADMLGKSDDEVKDLYNGGTENKTEDGSMLLGRTYATTLDGNAVTLETIYSDTLSVDYISASFTDKTAEEVKGILTNAFGTPEVVEEKDAVEAKYLKWTKDKVQITVNESYGMAAVNFSPVMG